MRFGVGSEGICALSTEYAWLAMLERERNGGIGAVKEWQVRGKVWYDSRELGGC